MELREALRRYLNHVLANRALLTHRNEKSSFKHLSAFLAAREVTRVTQLDHDVLMQYREELAWMFSLKGTPLTVRAQMSRLGHLRNFCRWLVHNDILAGDPSAKLPYPKWPQQLPRAVLEPNDVKTLLRQPDMATPRGYRDRVILEVLYSAALRRSEVAHLKVQDVDTETGYVQIRQGKGKKDRVVPLGQQACEWLHNYLTVIRPDWPPASDREDHLFLNRWGYGMCPLAVWSVVKKCAHTAKLKKPVTTHAFRHACATHMVRNGAPIRHLQEMLGHVELSTTQIYTHLTINDLKAVHRQYHPREQQSNEEVKR